jgi:polyisoprenoid-binding protein YceI
MSTHTTSPSTAVGPLALLTPGRWEIDLNHSRVGFAIRHLGVSKVRGVFRDVDADLVIGTTPESSSLSVTVALASIDTANPDRDAHVRSADLLDV